MDKINNNVFSQEENEELDKARRIRSNIIDVLTKEGIPDSPKEIRILNEVLTMQDNSIFSRAGTRLKSKEISTMETAKEEIIAILKQVKTTGEIIASQDDREERSIPVELVKGQLTLVEESDISEEFADK